MSISGFETGAGCEGIIPAGTNPASPAEIVHNAAQSPGLARNNNLDSYGTPGTSGSIAVSGQTIANFPGQIRNPPPPPFDFYLITPVPIDSPFAPPQQDCTITAHSGNMEEWVFNNPTTPTAIRWITAPGCALSATGSFVASLFIAGKYTVSLNCSSGTDAPTRNGLTLQIVSVSGQSVDVTPVGSFVFGGGGYSKSTTIDTAALFGTDAWWTLQIGFASGTQSPILVQAYANLILAE